MWNKINKKNAYLVQFNSEELIRKSVSKLNTHLKVQNIAILIEEGKQIESIADKETLNWREAFEKSMISNSSVKARWIASTNQTNWDIIKKQNIWGIPKRNKAIASRVTPEDLILFYVAQQKEGDQIIPSAIAGSYEILEIYEDSSLLFIAPPQMGDERFPYRFKLKPVKIFKTPMEFKPLIPDLTFITNKTMWSGHLRIAMREIPKEDYTSIMQKGKSL